MFDNNNNICLAIDDVEKKGKKNMLVEAHGVKRHGTLARYSPRTSSRLV